VRCRILVLLLLGATLWACGPADEPIDATATDPPVCPNFVAAHEGLPVTGEWRSMLSVADVNGDGLDDLAALPRKLDGPQVFLSDGLGSWTGSSEGLPYDRSFSCGVGTRLVDMDSDGHLDLVVADHCQGVRVYRGDGHGNWTEDSRGIPRNFEGVNDVAVGDINGDGVLDLIAVAAFNRGYLVLHGRPNGSFRVAKETGLPQVGSGWQLILEDINGDGRLDVVTSFNPTTTDHRQAPPSPSKVWLQDPDGRFRPAEGFTRDGRYFGLATVPRGEGRVPALILGVFGFHAGLHLYESETGEQWTEVGLVDDDWFDERVRGYSSVKVADINDDGCPDILTHETGTLGVLLAVGDCEGTWHLCPVDTIPAAEGQTGGWGIGTGDLNGDGRTDVASSHGTKHGSLRAWLQVDPATAEAVRNQGQGPPASRAARAGETSP